jgi:fumarate reductase subunit C
MSQTSTRAGGNLPQPVPILWWLGNASYFAFMLRELSCIFVAWFVVFLLYLVSAVIEGPSGYQEFLNWAASPPILLLNIVGLAFVIYHAVTFFNAAPQALVVRVGGERVPGNLIAGGHYAGWIAVSVLVFLILGA